MRLRPGDCSSQGPVHHEPRDLHPSLSVCFSLGPCQPGEGSVLTRTSTNDPGPCSGMPPSAQQESTAPWGLLSAAIPSGSETAAGPASRDAAFVANGLFSRTEAHSLQRPPAVMALGPQPQSPPAGLWPAEQVLSLGEAGLRLQTAPGAVPLPLLGGSGVLSRSPSSAGVRNQDTTW